MANITYSNCLHCFKSFVIPSNQPYKKFCNLSCSTAHKNKISKETKLQNYLSDPNYCNHCKSIMAYDSRKNKFCSQSCAAIHNNSKKDWYKIRTGPAKGSKLKNYCHKTRIKQCIVCSKFHPKSGETCSKECLSIHISNAVKGKTGGNRDCNLPGKDCSGKDFFFDSHWEIALSKSLSENNIYWVRPERFILSDGRSYSPDFYLPEYDIYIDPKAKRKGYYRKSLLKVQQFSSETGFKCLVITEQKFLTWGHVQSMLLLDVSWS